MRRMSAAEMVSRAQTAGRQWAWSHAFLRPAPLAKLLSDGARDAAVALPAFLAVRRLRLLTKRLSKQLIDFSPGIGRSSISTKAGFRPNRTGSSTR